MAGERQFQGRQRFVTPAAAASDFDLHPILY